MSLHKEHSSEKIKIKKGGLMQEIKKMISDDDTKDFIFVSIKDSDDSSGVSLITNYGSDLAPADILALAHAMAQLIATKVGFDEQMKRDGAKMDSKLVRTYAQIITEFAYEILDFTANNLVENETLAKKLVKAINNADPSKGLLNAQVEAKDRVKKYCDEECCEGCMNESCQKLVKLFDEIQGDDDDDNDDEDSSSILEKFINEEL